ncbi:MAG: phosphatidate cytidylyltransferase ['Candidatus Kapabacteria' thiocyanatum]|nr:phosphatidate cytidylyltransferase ['Candidatus Kapabacteria' thiocyanatum]
MSNMLQRILVGLVGIPLVIGLVYFGGWPFSAVMIIISALALREFYGLGLSKHADANVPFGMIWGICVQLAIAWMVRSPAGLTAGSIVLSAVVVTGTVLALTLELWRNKPNALLNVMSTVTGVIYVSGGLGSLIYLRGYDHPWFLDARFADGGASFILTLFVSVWMCDSVAYFAGMAFGKHKLFPRVSPKKSWEGAVAGGLGAIVAAIVLGGWLLPHAPMWLLATLGGIVGVFGQIGDLAESLMKRDATIKDSSHLIPGHGGVLDRFDSMLFVAPLICAILVLVNLYHG